MICVHQRKSAADFLWFEIIWRVLINGRFFCLNILPVILHYCLEFDACVLVIFLSAHYADRSGS